MKHISMLVSCVDELGKFLRSHETRTATDDARSVLVQIYTGVCDERWVRAVVSEVQQHLPQAAVVGATTFGEIHEGQARSGCTVVSLSCFSNALAVPVWLPGGVGDENAIASALRDHLKITKEPLKGLLLLATTISLDASQLLVELDTLAPGLPVFGGGAGDNGELKASLVFCGDELLGAGAVAVALCGEELEVIRATYLGWEPLGRPMRVTRASPYTIHSLDDQPAFEAYRRYLGIEADEAFFYNAMEFPFLVERQGNLIARVPKAALPDGSIEFTADVQEGEEVQFGYAHVDTIVRKVAETEAAIRRFAPEALYAYSCGCRHFVMQADVSLELAPFQEIAPTAGFFTYGEFCELGSSSLLLNSTLVIVGIREGPAPRVSDRSEPRGVSDVESIDVYSHNHIRVLKRFQHFTRAITEELEAANRDLAKLAERDALTGLYNRRVLESRLADEIRRTNRYGSEFSLLMCDVDFFKRLNDTFGHAAGDVVLIELAALFEDALRTSDFVCRYGGEEFVILLPQTGAQEALAFADRVRSATEARQFTVGTQQLPRVTLSFGIASCPSDGISASDLVVKADAALYAAKHAGRNCVRLSGPGGLAVPPVG